MKIRQYIPGFVDAEPRETEFSSLEELLRIPWVDRFREEFTRCEFCLDGNALMVDGLTTSGRRVWYVVGFVNGSVALPAWSAMRAPGEER